MAEENVKVAVRVRPFNQRERDANAKLIVEMNDNQTILTNPKTNEEKRFAYDHSYWYSICAGITFFSSNLANYNKNQFKIFFKRSHDGFKTDQRGYHAPDSGNNKYCDQVGSPSLFSLFVVELILKNNCVLCN